METTLFFSKQLIDAPLFSQFDRWSKQLESSYNTVFSALVYNNLPKFEEIKQSIKFIQARL